jgi:Flp pilus assembly protein TadG
MTMRSTRRTFGPHLRWRPFLRSEDGGAAVEFALISTPLFMLLFAILEISRAYYVQNSLSYSVEQAARCASIDTVTCGTSTQIKAFAANRSGATFDSSIFTSSNAACGRLVTGSYPFTFSVPFLARNVNLTARACYPA